MIAQARRSACWSEAQWRARLRKEESERGRAALAPNIVCTAMGEEMAFFSSRPLGDGYVIYLFHLRLLASPRRASTTTCATGGSAKAPAFITPAIPTS